MNQDRAQHGRASVARNAGVISLAVTASRVLGLVRDQVFAALFGAGLQYDAFLTAFRIPNLLARLVRRRRFVRGLRDDLHSGQQSKGAEEAFRLSNRVATALVLVLSLTCVLGWIFAPSIVYWLAPGFYDVPGKAELTVHLTRIMMPFLLLIALAAKAMGILNARNKFAIPAIAPVFFNLGSVVVDCSSVSPSVRLSD
jgi:putative peptidoglycan lipid II flippase